MKIQENPINFNRFWRAGWLGPGIWQAKPSRILPKSSKKLFPELFSSKIWENPPNRSSGRLRLARPSSGQLGPTRFSPGPQKIDSWAQPTVKNFYCWDGWFRSRWLRMFLNFFPFSIFLTRVNVLSASVARTTLAGPTVNSEEMWQFEPGSHRP